MIKSGLRNGWNWYQRQWTELKGWKFYLFILINYTVLFLIFQMGVFSAFYSHGKSFIWTTDGTSQHYPRFLYISSTIHDTLRNFFAGKGLDFPLYDFTMGLESRDLQWFNFPMVLAALFPTNKIELFYSVFVLGCYYSVGISFILMALHFKADPFSAIIGSLAYSFSGFGLYAIVRHPTFGLPMILLPLLIMGTDMVLHRRSGWLLLVSTFFALTQSLYFSCMMAVLCFIYSAVRFFDVYTQKRMKELSCFVGRLAVWIGTAVMLSGFIVFPTLHIISDTGRVGNNIFDTYDPLFYGDAFYVNFTSFFLTEANSGTGGHSSWTYLSFSVLSIPAICLLFARHRKGERSLGKAFIIVTIMLGIPAISYTMSGFNNLNNRFVFGYALLIASIITFMVSRYQDNQRKDYLKAGILLIAYIAVCTVFLPEANRRIDAVVFMILSVLMIALVKMLQQKTAAVKICCFVIMLVSVLYSANRLYYSPVRKYINEFSGDVQTIYENNQYHALKESEAVSNDETFFRATGNAMTRSDSNMSFYYQINDLIGNPGLGLSTYYTDWLKELEVAYYDEAHRIFGVDSRAALLTMTSNKYYAVRDSKGSIVPYGYEKVDWIQNKKGKEDIIYQNVNWLPVGFTYDKYLLRETYESLSPLQKQEALLQAAVIEKVPGSSSITEANLELSCDRVPFKVKATSNVGLKNGKLNVKEKNGTFVLSFKAVPNSETYLRIVGLDLTSGTETRKWTITAVGNNGAAGKARFFSDYFPYSHKQHSQMINLGYSEEGISEITITFPSKGTCKLEGFEVYCQPMDSYAEQVSGLNQETLQNVKTTGNSLEGTISVSSDKLLCVSIPYLDDWEAFVDGKPTELYHINTAFMGVELPAGDHTVRFVYHMHGLKLGLIVSGVGVICLIVLIIFRRKRKNLKT